MKKLNQFFVIITTISVTAAFAAKMDDDIPLADLSPAVQKTIKSKVGNGQIKEIEVETEEGKSYYEVDFVKGDKRLEFNVDMNGKALTEPRTVTQRFTDRTRELADNMVEKDLRLDDLPTAVKKTVVNETSGASIKEIDREKHDGITFYEVEYVKDDNRKEIVLDTDGKVTKRNE